MRGLCGCGRRSSTPCGLCLPLPIWNSPNICARVSLWVDSFALLPLFFWHQIFPFVCNFIFVICFTNLISFSAVISFYLFCILCYIIFGEVACNWIGRARDRKQIWVQRAIKRKTMSKKIRSLYICRIFAFMKLARYMFDHLI